VLAAVYEDPRDAASLVYVRSDSVLKHLETVWDGAPRDAAYYLQQAAYHESERRPAVTLAAADRAIELSGALGGASPDAPHARAVSARIGALRGLGRIDEAIAAASAELAKAPSATAHVDLARALLAANKNDDANAELDRAIAIDPCDLMALDLRWWPAERHDLELLQKAIPPLTANAEAHAQNAGAWRMLARAKLAVGDSDAAMALFEKAVALAPDDDDLRAEWWGELARQAKFDTVLTDAAKVADIGKRDWRLRWNEAEALLAAGKKMEAQAAFAAINRDESLLLDVRRRAKRAATSVGGAQ
jgi:tetratricopeptide (TPR) repeat protein